MNDYKIKMWDYSGKAMFSVKDADLKKLKKKMNEMMKEKLF